jgi:hypothetical protein
VSDPNPSEFQLPTDLVIESHTDSEADIRAAFDVPETKTPKPDTKPPVSDTEPPADDTIEADGETVAEPDTKPAAVVRKSKALTRQEQIQADINAATRLKHETARELDTAKRELAAVKAERAALVAPAATAAVITPLVPPVAVVATPKPKVSDFEDLDLWSDAVADWSTAEAERKVEAKLALAAAATQKTTDAAAANESRQAAVQEYQAQGEALKAEFPDYDDVVTNNQDIHVSGVMEVAILTSKHGGRIAYYLGTHPEEAAALAADTKDLGEAGLALVRRTLEARIERSTPSTPHDAAPPVTATASAARTTNTPKPFSAVASGAAASTKKLDQLSADDYFALRNKQEFEKTGRL